MDTRTFRAHFEGTHIVPDEAINLPTGAEVEVTVVASASKGDLSIEEKKAAFNRFLSFATPAGIPDESLRRENLYEDRG